MMFFVTKNEQVANRTKHIDTKYHYVNEQQDKGNVKIEFVATEDNMADSFTKNVSEKIFSKHTSMLLDGKMLRWREDDKM